jgi:hypothetical protein
VKQSQAEHAPRTALSKITTPCFDAGEVVNVADTAGPADLKTAYDQLCTSYRAIDDFRAKLLGFLPLVTGGGLILLTGRSNEVRMEFFKPVGLFGIAVTAGLLAYELFGIKKCHALIEAGKALETKLHLPAGQFLGRPDHLLWVVNEPFAAATIYPAVLAAWTYLAFFFEAHNRGKVISLWVFVVGFVGVLLYDQFLKHEKRLHEKLGQLRHTQSSEGVGKHGAAGGAPAS